MHKIPRTVAADNPNSYPRWLDENCIQFDLARTVAVAGIPDPQMCGAVKAAFCKEFGDDSVEECSAPSPFSGVVYVRLGRATNCKLDAEPKSGCQCAYEAVETLDQARMMLMLYCKCNFS